MAVITLESLVLRGFTVLSGGTAGNPRLGASCTATPMTPEDRISMRRPSRDCGQEFPPAMRLGHADYLRVDALAAYGAGRSHSRSGVLRRNRLRPSTGAIAMLVSAGVTPAVIPLIKRGSAGRGWCKPAQRTERVAS
jgi:hypothetical protein